MRKRLITPTPESVRSCAESWLEIERVAIVEITSEEKDHPVESAFVSGETQGWRAAEPGAQTIRLIFDQPQRLKQILLMFEENETTRTQEFVLRWSSDHGNSFREIVRQQWNFSPRETIREVEEYQVELSHVTILELKIVPNEWRNRSGLAQNSAFVMRRDHGFLIPWTRMTPKKTARPRVLAPGSLLVSSVKEVGRFLPGNLSAPW